jgi:hypothetical protein
MVTVRPVPSVFTHPATTHSFMIREKSVVDHNPKEPGSEKRSDSNPELFLIFFIVKKSLRQKNVFILSENFFFLSYRFQIINDSNERLYLIKFGSKY